MAIALGFVAALIGAAAALIGTWLSTRQAARLEREKWERSNTDGARDARAAAIVELTRDLAAALQTIVWFTFEAGKRTHDFSAASIQRYDAEMLGHLTEITKGLVTVAHHDPAAFRDLDQLATEVYDLDGDLAHAAASYWNEPENTLQAIGDRLSDAYTLQRRLPHRVVDVLHASKAVPRPNTDD